MTVEAQHVRGSQRYRMRTRDEQDRAFLRAERHSQQVRILRKALPILSVVVVMAYFIFSAGFSITVGDVTASISGVEVSNGNLRMVNPKLKGADKKNGPYVISADYADQDMKNPKMIKLHAIKAEVNGISGGWSKVEAERGIFNSEAEHLSMRDNIRVHTSSGVEGRLIYATLDMKSQTLRSHLPVAFDMTNGTVRANALTFFSSKNTLIFRGKVAVHLIKPKEDVTADGSPAKPPKVAAPATPARQAAETVAPPSEPGGPQ